MEMASILWQELAGNGLNPTAVPAVTTEAGPGMDESALLSFITT